MTYLYLIRHPQTLPDSAVPPSQWRLTPQGKRQVQVLARAPFWTHVAALYTSDQHKTTIVGEAVKAAHGIPFTPFDTLGEARRDAWIGSEAFVEAQRAFFDQLDSPPCPGWEPASDAQARFVAAMDQLLARHPVESALAVVAHGTVLTLYTAHLRHEAPTYDAWRQIGFAAVMAVERATMTPKTPFLTAPYDRLLLPGATKA
ncbi:MAG: histidine phosphatase family protein [Anaerolineae bacterium]|nr:histidine phosphatase family protein [Anaerolineae bacterium]